MVHAAALAGFLPELEAEQEWCHSSHQPVRDSLEELHSQLATAESCHTVRSVLVVQAPGVLAAWCSIGRAVLCAATCLVALCSHSSGGVNSVRGGLGGSILGASWGRV